MNESRLTRPAASMLGIAALFAACRDAQHGVRSDAASAPADGGSADVATRDATPGIDVRDAGGQDVADAETIDASFRDANVVPRTQCGEAAAWAIATDIVDTTTRSTNAERLRCAGVGPSASAPEQWRQFVLASPSHLVLRLGAAGWDAVLAARTGTCAPSVEECRDDPTVLELPNVQGRVFVGVDGFGPEGGPYILRARTGPPLEVPARNRTCDRAEPLELGRATVGHTFGSDAATEGASECAMFGAVYHSFDLTASATVTFRVEPAASADLSMALFSDCGRPLYACLPSEGPGLAAATVPLARGTWTLAVGRRQSASPPGSFRVSVVSNAECARSRDCPVSSRCSDLGRCELLPATALVSTVPIAIPDDGAVTVELPILEPTTRPDRVAIRLQIEHPHPRDLVIDLEAPSMPSAVRLRDRNDGLLDVLYGGETPADGPGTLEDFGLAPTARGTWRLRIEDRAPGDVGFLTGLQLWVE